MISVVIADDQLLLRESLKFILDNDEEIRVVGTAGNGREAIDLCVRLQPDVVLMDVGMPELDGVGATKAVKEQCPRTKVIILTTFEDPDSIIEAFLSNADGYIVKNISHTDLVLTVKCVSGGLTVIDESVRCIIIDKFKRLSGCRAEVRETLSDKELELIRLIAAGKNNREIAALLSYSEGTIKNHVSKLYDRLGVSDRMQIAIFALENGIM